MFDFNIDNYINNIARTPKQNFRELAQATMNSEWEHTTQIYNIKEQKAFPFEDIYEEYESWVNSVSNVTVNTNKNVSDFIDILFKDIDHKQNYRGQYYKLTYENSLEENTFICYDKMNPLNLTRNFKCVRCNNILKWIDKESGNVIELPCYLGEDISSTNNLKSSEGIVPNVRIIVMVQANDYTKKIIKNQRFMFEHTQAFKVEEVNNYQKELDTNGEVTLIKMYIVDSTLTSKDNKEENLCDYYESGYKLEILEEVLVEKSKGESGKFNAIVKFNNEQVDMPLEWSTADTETLELDSSGNYRVIGESGSMAQITCHMVDNIEVKDTLELKVIDNSELKEVLVVSTDDFTLRQQETKEIKCGVYVNGIKTSKKVTCTPSFVDNTYKLKETLEGFELKNINANNISLILTFSAIDTETIKVKVDLRRLM